VMRTSMCVCIYVCGGREDNPTAAAAAYTASCFIALDPHLDNVQM
jgi:hypothetical protein